MLLLIKGDKTVKDPPSNTVESKIKVRSDWSPAHRQLAFSGSSNEEFGKLLFCLRLEISILFTTKLTVERMGLYNLQTLNAQSCSFIQQCLSSF